RLGLPGLRRRARRRLARREGPPEAPRRRQRTVHQDRPRRRVRLQRGRGMSARRIETLPTIRAKLGSVIVFAVALTIAGVYVVLGLALRNSFRDADLVELLRTAQARSADTGSAAVAG